MARIILRSNYFATNSAQKFDVYLSNTYIGVYEGGYFEVEANTGTNLLIFRNRLNHSQTPDASFKVVINDTREIVELQAQVDADGNLAVFNASGAPHSSAYNNYSAVNNANPPAAMQRHEPQAKNEKKKRGCLFAVIAAAFALLLIVAVIVLGSDTPAESGNPSQSEQVTEAASKGTVLYSDDKFKITFVDFNDPNLGTTSYNLMLKIENNSDQTVVVSPSEGYANDEAVFLGSGLPVTVKPNKTATGAFIVGYGTTSIKSIDEVKTLELKITLYDENYSKEILVVDDIVINLK